MGMNRQLFECWIDMSTVTLFELLLRTDEMFTFTIQNIFNPMPYH